VPPPRVVVGRDPVTGLAVEKRLPPVRLMASCRSNPLDSRREGSEAVIVWFANTLDVARLSDLVDEHAWTSTARDYDS
jgi:hypothetical protein